MGPACSDKPSAVPGDSTCATKDPGYTQMSQLPKACPWGERGAIFQAKLTAPMLRLLATCLWAVPRGLRSVGSRQDQVLLSPWPACSQQQGDLRKGGAPTLPGAPAATPVAALGLVAPMAPARGASTLSTKELSLVRARATGPKTPQRSPTPAFLPDQAQVSCPWGPPRRARRSCVASALRGLCPAPIHSTPACWGRPIPPAPSPTAPQIHPQLLLALATDSSPIPVPPSLAPSASTRNLGSLSFRFHGCSLTAHCLITVTPALRLSLH